MDRTDAKKRGMKKTPERVARIVDALKNGLPVTTAATRGGICRATYYEWIHRHADFAAAVQEAVSEAEVALLATIRAASHQQWQAAAWILERRFPESWSKRSEVQASGPVEITVRRVAPIDYTSLNDKQLERIANGENVEAVIDDLK